MLRAFLSIIVSSMSTLIYFFPISCCMPLSRSHISGARNLFSEPSSRHIAAAPEIVEDGHITVARDCAKLVV